MMRSMARARRRTATVPHTRASFARAAAMAKASSRMPIATCTTVSGTWTSSTASVRFDGRRAQSMRVNGSPASCTARGRITLPMGAPTRASTPTASVMAAVSTASSTAPTSRASTATAWSRVAGRSPSLTAQRRLVDGRMGSLWGRRHASAQTTRLRGDSSMALSLAPSHLILPMLSRRWPSGQRLRGSHVLCATSSPLCTWKRRKHAKSCRCLGCRVLFAHALRRRLRIDLRG
mmetsp:Transcript_1969/g.5556  ORF Transcript_1969/g.5556 Transcript_1969/m.5556 type:complete len:234 (-) Transcript_1969:408-1109(-)